MVNYKYTTTQLFIDSIDSYQGIDSIDANLIDSFSLNTQFNQSKHRVEIYFYSLGGSLLGSDPNYNSESHLLEAAGAGKLGSQGITIDPTKDIINYGYETGDILALYHFLNNLFSESRTGGSFFIESISDDRTEIRALSNEISSSDISKYVSRIKSALTNFAYFSEFYINFGSNQVLTSLNLDIDEISKGTSVVFKLYKPLPPSFSKNSTFTVEEKVIDTKIFQITSEILQEAIVLPSIKGPNFNVEVTTNNYNPTEYLDFNHLFSAPIEGSDYKLYALSNEKGINLSIDYSNFQDFIYFSSAEERINNFQYKLGLIQNYESKRTGSVSYYNTLIGGILSNFDHYDRYLYFESGSNAWPKSNSTAPYVNLQVSDRDAIDWYTNIIETASSYDNTNESILIGDIPIFLREDPNNAPYLMFVHMIGQHFDNIWIYSKAITDRYDSDNRLNFGVSRDLIRESIEGLGISLYNSNFSFSNLFNSYIGSAPSGSNELITNEIIATAGTDSQYLQPVSTSDYEKEIYKRIYHNIPFLLKTKGTERGLRALINCFGIPDTVLNINTFGGIRVENTPFLGPLSKVSSTLDKIRTDNTGPIVKGNTLSRYASIINKSKIYSDDQNLIEVGFDISTSTNEYIKQQLENFHVTFNIDDYIGDPRLIYSGSYKDLNLFGNSITGGDSTVPGDPSISYSKDPNAFIRLVRFFDSRVFRMIKDFVPARTNLSTGIIIKDHNLHRNKAKQVKGSGIDTTYSSSILIGAITGSDGGIFSLSTLSPFTTNYSADYITPLGSISRNITDESPRLNGVFSGSTLTISNGSLNNGNPFLKNVQPILPFSLTWINAASGLPPECFTFLIGSNAGTYTGYEIFLRGSYVGP